jgi:hypothetical protein
MQLISAINIHLCGSSNATIIIIIIIIMITIITIIILLVKIHPWCHVLFLYGIMYGHCASAALATLTIDLQKVILCAANKHVERAAPSSEDRLLFCSQQLCY